MQISMDWQDGMKFTGTSIYGHEISTDAPKKVGGGEDGYQPLELMLFGLAGCTGMDIINIARKMRQDVRGLKVIVNAEQDENPPRRIPKAHIEYQFTGNDLNIKKLEQAIKLSEEKYCSVGATMREHAEITHSYKVNGE